MIKNLVFGDCVGFATVFSQFNIVHTCKSHHTKGEPLNYPMKVTTPTFKNNSIRPHPLVSV